MAQATFIDYYRILKVPSSATGEQIRTAYLRLAKRQHPDKGGSLQAMRRLNVAYETLRSPAMRAEYDRYYHSRKAEDGIWAGDDVDIDEVDAFLHEVYQQERLRQWLHPLMVGLGLAVVAVLLFVIVAVGRTLTSAGSAHAAPSPPKVRR